VTIRLGYFYLFLTPLLAGSGAAVAAPPTLDPDLMTVSGRAALPSGLGSPLGERLELGEVSVDPAVPTLMHVKSDELRVALGQAIDKSLRNYSYRWNLSATPAAENAPPPARASLNVDVLPLEVTPDAKGSQVIARLKLTTAADGGACFPFEAKGQFHALTPLHSGSDQKALAILVVVASAAAGWNAGAFAADQFRSADAAQNALNSGRAMDKGEGVAPQGGDQVLVRYGAVNALQFAVTDMISHLGEPGGCNHPGAPTSPANAAAASLPGVSLATGPAKAQTDASPAPSDSPPPRLNSKPTSDSAPPATVAPAT
jgi:hypothetical protein